MRVYDWKDQQGRVFAFEVPNIGRGGVCIVVAQIPGAKLLRSPRFLSWFREEMFCEFELEDRRFVVSEPFGDNSRYLVGPLDGEWYPQISAIRSAFAEANSFVLGLKGLFGWWKRHV